MQNFTVKGYILSQKLGAGGMAEVWLAENEIGKPAAVKILRKDLSFNEDVVNRFKNEAKVMVTLNHPNIRQVYDYGELDGRPCIIMEYLDGSDLSARLKNGERFTDAQLRDWWNQLVEALAYTHARGVVHRDIKPSNIFLTNDGKVKLLDFGIAKVKGSITATQTGTRMGTLMYMSPEQVKDSKYVDYRSDIYSLGVTFYHLVTGCAPYDNTSSSEFEIQTMIVTEPLQLDKLTQAWRNVLKPCLHKDFQQRPDLKSFGDKTVQNNNTFETEATLVLSKHKPTITTAPSPKPMAQSKVKKNKIVFLVSGGVLLLFLAGWLIYGTSGIYPDQGLIGTDDTAVLDSSKMVVNQQTTGNGLADNSIKSAQPEKQTPTQEEMEWKSAKKINKSTSYRSFLAKYPNSTYAKQAKDKINQLEQAEATAIPGKASKTEKINNTENSATTAERRATNTEQVSEVVNETDNSVIFNVVEDQPIFPGGQEALIRFLTNNIIYPDQARRKSIQGTVYLTFVVERDGSVTDVKVLRGIGGGCDEEAVRVIRSMPKWSPGKQRGQPVRVQFNMPIKFTLAG